MDARKIVGLMACDPRGIIGNKGVLPWCYPQELDHFRRTTYQQIMVMGRKTFESIPPTTLKDRFNIVFSRKYKESHWIGDTVVFVSSLKSFSELAGILPEKEMYMIGGAQIARLFLEANLLSAILLTKIHTCYEGDAIFSLALLEGWVKETIKKEEDFTLYRYTPPMTEKSGKINENQTPKNACD